MSDTVQFMSLLSVLMTTGLTDISPSYSSYPHYGDDYQYYDQPSPITSIKTVLINQSFTVDCVGMPPDKEELLQLVHNGQEVEEYHMEQQIVGEESVYSFLVTKASLTDSGRWSCVGSGSGQENLHLIAVLPAVNLVTIVMDGEVISNQSILTVQEGMYIQPVCALIQSQGHHHPSSAVASWRIGAEPMEEDIEQMVSITSEGREHITSIMNSFPADRTHSGTLLECRIHGQSAGVELQVEYQPEFTISREPGLGTPVLRQMRVTLGCEGGGGNGHA